VLSPTLCDAHSLKLCGFEEAAGGLPVRVSNDLVSFFGLHLNGFPHAFHPPYHTRYLISVSRYSNGLTIFMNWSGWLNKIDFFR